MAILQWQAISYSARSKAILNQVSLEVDPGECVGLIGPNGSGKTTLLKVGAGLITPDCGQVWLEGQPLSELKRREIARRLGYVPQQALLDFQFSVQEVVLSGRNPYLGRFRVETEEDRRISREALELADLTELTDRLVTNLSGGERQRVIIARALAQQPALLLLDEPTASLDLRHQHEIMALLSRLCQEKGLGVIVALHDLNLAGRYCDRVVALSAGEVVAEGSPATVLTQVFMRQVFEVEAQVELDPEQPNKAQVTVLGVALSPKVKDV